MGQDGNKIGHDELALFSPSERRLRLSDVRANEATVMRIVDIVLEEDQIVAVWSDGTKSGGKHRGREAAIRLSELRSMYLKLFKRSDGKVPVEEVKSARDIAIIMYLDELAQAGFLPQRANAGESQPTSHNPEEPQHKKDKP